MSERAVQLRTAFAQLVEDPGGFRLFDAALMFSTILQRGATWPGAHTYMHELEHEASLRCTPLLTDAPRAAAQELMRMIAEHGFTGDTERYEDVRNSFIDRVLERRVGLPITLSVIALHLAEHIGLPLRGVAFPGHFLVGLELDAPTPALFDAFNDGRQLSFDDIALLYAAVTDQDVEHDHDKLREQLKPSHSLSTLSRMLRNLQHHYSIRGCHDRAAEVVQLLLVLHPDVAAFHDLHDELQRRLVVLN